MASLRTDAANSVNPVPALVESVLAGMLTELGIEAGTDGLRSRVSSELEALPDQQLPAFRSTVARTLGKALLDCGRFDYAERALRVAADDDPANAALQSDLAFALFQNGQGVEGIAALRTAVRCAPDEPQWHLNLGTALALAGSDEAYREFRYAAKLQPGSSEPWRRIGDLQRRHGQPGSALASYLRALSVGPDCVDSLHELARTFVSLGLRQKALESYERLVQLKPADIAVLDEVGGWLRTSGQPHLAIDWYRKALELAPESAELHNNLATAHMDANDYPAALPLLEAAVRLNPGLTMANNNLATVLHNFGDFRGALRYYREAVRLQEDFLYPRVQALTLSRILALWEDWDAEIAQLARVRPRPGNTAAPLELLFLPLDPAIVRIHTEAYVVEHAEPQQTLLPFSRRPNQSNRIRIGYVSDELRKHAVGSLAVEVLEVHDKSLFDIYLYTWGAQDVSPVEQRAQSAATVVRDITTLSSREAAELVAADGIDILVDLKGHTVRPRLGIYQYRPAPVQATWLGFPGTTGTNYMDYVIADGFVVPGGSEGHYTEMIARLPDTYQPNDRQRRAAAPFSRSAYGLPETGVVYCYLGKSSKITPEVFEDWMDVLQAVPGSVLWMLAEHDETRTNLLSEALRRGVAADRLCFAVSMEFTQHLARFSVADVALDTYPYGSHTTASEALWQGCPLVTRVGDSFASRVPGSLLRAAGAPELVTRTREDFRALAIALGKDSLRRLELRRKLEASRTTSALFDTPRFTRNLEALYTQMRDRAASGLPPAHLEIGAGDRAAS